MKIHPSYAFSVRYERNIAVVLFQLQVDALHGVELLNGLQRLHAVLTQKNVDQ